MEIDDDFPVNVSKNIRRTIGIGIEKPPVMRNTSSSASRSQRPTPSSSLVRTEFESLLSESSDEEQSQPAGKHGELSKPTREKSATNSNQPDAAIFDNDTDEIILSLIWYNGHLGASYYNIVTGELFVMEDALDDIERFDVIKAVYRQCAPHYVLTTTAAPAALKNVIKSIITSETSGEEQASNVSRLSARSAVLKVACKREHSHERCSHRVRCLRLDCEPENSSNADRLTFLNSILNFKCCAMIHALGSLLLFVDKHWNNIALDRSGNPSFVSLNYITLQGLVMVDEDTYKALNIVQDRDHPSLFKFGESVTQTRGVSLFSLFNRYCQSGPGTLFLWRTLFHPTQDLVVLERRQKVIQFFLDPNNQTVVEHLSSCLRQVYRLHTTVFACCSGPQAKPSNWYKLHKTLSQLICIADICEEYVDGIELFKRIAESVTTGMQYAKYFIEYIVDFSESRREGRLMVKTNVDPLLDELNHVRRTLPELLTQMGEKDMREHLPPSVTGCNMLYLPNIGYVLAINKWNPTPPEDITLPNFEFKFSINQVHYYKSPSAKELDETVGDIVLKIAVRQNHIVQKLIRYARKHTGAILHSVQLCGELDTLLAFYKVARDFNYTRPTLTKSKVVDVKEARHPLIECSNTFVPNDIASGNGRSLIKVLTGPNSCGKSVYLKQIGLAVFMAHIGSYVPAKSATIGLVSHILTQMATTESVGLNASSFLQNLRQINVALRASVSNSIVISDELDRGTNEISGLSLVAAVLNTFAERGNECPHVFAVTHAYNVLPLLLQTTLIELQTFEYTINEDESMAFLYRLTNGSTTRSYAHCVARIAGLDEDIVKRGLEVFEKMKRHELPSNIFPPRTEAIRRIVRRLETGQGLKLNELKSLVRQCVYPK